MRFSTADKVNIGFAVGLAILLVIGVSSIASIGRFLTTSREVGRRHAVLVDLQSLVGRLAEAESAQRGFRSTP